MYGNDAVWSKLCECIQCCNLVISWLWTQSVIVLPSLARVYVGLRWSKYSTYSTVCASDVLCSARVCTVWAINRVVLRISICFCATLLDFMSQIERLHFRYYCADVWKVLVHFCTVTHAHRRRGVCRSFHDAPCVLGRSVARAQSWLLQRLLGLFVARCALVRNSLQTSCLQ